MLSVAEDKNNIPAVRHTPPVWLALRLRLYWSHTGRRFGVECSGTTMRTLRGLPSDRFKDCGEYGSISAPHSSTIPCFTARFGWNTISGETRPPDTAC